MATTLRSYNKRMRAFNAPPIKRSRRGLAEGGLAEGKMLPDVPEYSGTDYELGGAEISTEDQRRLASPMSRTYYQRGGVAVPPVAGPVEKGRTMTEEEKRSLREASAPQGSWPRMSGAQQTTPTKRLGLAAGGMLDPDIPQPSSPEVLAAADRARAERGLTERGLGTFQQTFMTGGATDVGNITAALPFNPARGSASPMRTLIGTKRNEPMPRSALQRLPQRVQDILALGSAIERSAKTATKNMLRDRWLRLHAPSPENDKHVTGPRAGFAVGGPVAVGRIEEPEDESELMTERERRKLFPPELPTGIEPGADISVGRVTFGGTPASLREAEVAAPASPEEEAMTSLEPMFEDAPSAVTPVARGADMPAFTEPSEMEQVAGLRIAGLRRFGLDPFSAREKQVAGAPGITKYRDASGRTLYANTLEDQGRVSTVPSTFKQDDARLTAAIKARLASGHPQDIEQARQLAVTPEQWALIGEAENMQGLRQRAARGDRGALLEMQGREARAGAAAGRELELLKIMLGREPTPLQLAEFGLRKDEVTARLGREERQDALAQNQATIQNVFGSDEAGKAAQTRFYQRLATTLPQFQGDISRVPPAQLNALVQGSRLLDLIEQGKAPSAIARFFGGKQPRYDELMDAFNKAEIVPQRGFFNPFIKTPIGDISKGDVDEGTWRWLTHFVGNLHRNRQEAGLRGG